jgi:dihydrolipoamide dehydrogenase
MKRRVEVAILGAGSAGLYALAQVRKKTSNYVLIDGGELGTTCARVGCMPSKAMIQVAEDFHRRKLFNREGIEGAEHLVLNSADALEHVQDLRDIFVDKVLSSSIDQMGDEFIAENARFTAPGILVAGDQIIEADTVIIATGSSPVVPDAWNKFDDFILTTDNIFELETLPESMAVIGLGVIGLELGQSLHRMGVKVTGIDQLNTVCSLTDEETNRAAIEILGKEFPLWLGEPANIESIVNKLKITAGEQSVTVDKVLLSIGRRPNLVNLDLNKAGIHVNDAGIPDYDPNTMQINGHPVYIAGDVNTDRPLLHEASDEGRIAGFNAVAPKVVKFQRKTAFSITFTDPNIVTIGQSSSDSDDVITASLKFGPLGRALIMGKNRGLLKLFARKADGVLLGASMVAPHGEHLGHLIAWAIEQKMTVLKMLRMPFYHPVIEEALQPLLRELLEASDLEVESIAELERIN